MVRDMTGDETKIEKSANALKELAEVVPVYQDAVQPAAKEIGKALVTTARAVNVALAPIKGLVWGYEQLEQFLASRVAQKLRNTPEEEIVTPPPYVAGPALEALRFAGHDNTLRELYANLLASSMDAATAQMAHPGFVEILKQLSPDEARLLQLMQLPVPFPIISVRNESKEQNKGGVDALVHFSLLGQQAGCQYINLIPSYLSNFVRLGIIEIPTFFTYTDEKLYEPLEKHPTVTVIKAQIESNQTRKAVINREGARITPLGRQFINACVVPHESKRPVRNDGAQQHAQADDPASDGAAA